MSHSSSSAEQSIRSFVRRQGRLTPAQRDALARLLPIYGLDDAQTPWDLTRIFGRRAQRTLEIGFGNGEALLAAAAAQPHEDFIGIEVHRPGVGRALLGIEAQALANVRLACMDAMEVLRAAAAAASIDRVWVFFPDPWHKKRHHKRRLVRREFADLVAQALRPGGELHLATDWQDYAAHMETVLDTHPAFERAPRESGARARPRTKYERRGLRLGHGVWDLRYLRVQE